ncbi:MAG: DNA replication and repair protein RecF [Synergistaceae bacterium]
MGFKKVKFNNFRNIKPREIELDPGLNLLVGINGSGKTNILEGINIISGWGPFEKSTKNTSLSTWESGSEDVWLTGMIDSENKEIIKIKIANRIIIKYEEKSISATDLRWKIPVLSFLSNDISILEDSASYRRRLIDMMLALLIPSYATRLHNYRKSIKYKSILLKKGQKTEIIDKVISPLAEWIWKMREEGVSLISDCIKEIKELVPEETEITLKKGGINTINKTEENYLSQTAINKEKEKILKTPIVGPHRDDIIIKIKNKMAVEALSRGYRRRLAIAIILAISDGVKRKLGINPVLLLDEITAELDSDGREQLYQALLQRKTQVIAATAEPNIEKFPGKIHRVSEGSVEKE